MIADADQPAPITRRDRGLGTGQGYGDSVASMARSRVLIAVPSLGLRADYLDDCLRSIREQSVDADIALVSPDTPALRAVAERFGATLIPDPGSLPSAVNAALDLASQEYEYVNWLGDDDLLTPGSLEATLRALDADPAAVVAYGACRYIDSHGGELWVSRAGRWANHLLSWGPDLIPQPGMLIRSTAWRAVGGVDASYRLAFDLDLLLRLRKVGTLVDVDTVVSCFRWHPDSLTASNRDINIAESERAKRSALGPTARRLAWLWERPVRVATRLAAAEVQRRAISRRRADVGSS